LPGFIEIDTQKVRGRTNAGVGEDVIYATEYFIGLIEHVSKAFPGGNVYFQVMDFIGVFELGIGGIQVSNDDFGA
jgi:hypothetical protein